MNIVVTSTGKELSSQLDNRFGRAKYFILYKTDDSTSSAHDNNMNLSAAQGAGIQAAQNVVDLGAEVVITGNCGPKAFRVLTTAKIKIYIASNCTIQEALDSYSKNQLKELNDSNVEGHWA